MKGDDTMANRNTYTEQTWENLPSEETPISAERLAHMEDGIKEASNNRALKEIYNDDGMILGNGTASGSAGNYILAGSLNKVNGGGALVMAGSDNSANGAGGVLCAGQNNNLTGGSGICAGINNKLGGSGNLVSGYENEAMEGGSAAMGAKLKAVAYQTVVGKYNQKDEEHQYLFIVGGGTSDANRKNAHTVDFAGNGYFAGDVTNGAGVSLNNLNEKIVFMTYEETTAALTSQETGEINKIPNVYAIRDWCKALVNPSEEV